MILPITAFGLNRARAASAASSPPAVPDLHCLGATDHPESTQGRTPLADFKTGRSNEGYTCNASALGHFGTTGGFRVYRYVDTHGHVCAFYDSTMMFPTNLFSDTHKTGVYVLDMTNPAKPVMTANLQTPAMQSPHESLSLNAKRGLLAADMGNAATYPGFVDIYDVSKDCRHPALDSTLPDGVIGHEGTFSPDGNTFWVTSVAGNLAAVDVSNPTLPKIIYLTHAYTPHGLNISDDGRTLYFADLGATPLGVVVPPNQYPSPHGLTILDVSQIQDRQLDPSVKELSHITWDTVSIPQVPVAVTIHGHPYLIEIDEFDALGAAPGYDATSPVGAARIIDVGDPRHPRVISNLRLAVNQPAARAGSQQDDPGAATNGGGYAGHYCGVPQRQDPGIVACSFIMSGLRVFDIRDPYHPKEIAYFNMPPKTASGSTSYQGSASYSQPAFDPAHGQIWYVDANSGFWAVQINPKVWPFSAPTKR